MRRFVFPLALALVAAPLVAALVIYAMDDDEGTTVEPRATAGDPSVRGQGVPVRTCDEGEPDPLPSDRRDELALDEAADRIEEILGHPAPAPAVPASWTVAAERVRLVTRPYEEPVDNFQYRTADDDGAALIYGDGEQIVVSIIYQLSQHCDDFSPYDPVAVSSGASSVDVNYDTSAGGRSVVSGDDEERSFTYEAITGMFVLPGEPKLHATVVIEWDESIAPSEDAQMAELENWVRAILIAAENQQALRRHVLVGDR